MYGPIEPGDLDLLVTIEGRPAEDIPESSGFPTDGAWTTLAELVPMRRERLTARERFTADQVSATDETQWLLMYRADMDPDLVDVPKVRRLVYQGRVVDIMVAQMVGRLEGIALTTLGSSRVPS